jgi:hypothetical protein
MNSGNRVATRACIRTLSGSALQQHSSHWMFHLEATAVQLTIATKTAVGFFFPPSADAGFIQFALEFYL